MAQVTLQINGRPYRVACDDGEEAHLERLGRYVDGKVVDLAKQSGSQAADTRLLLMAALTIADELAEAKGGIDRPAPSGTGAAPVEDRAISEAIDAVSSRIEAIADKLERP